VTDTKTGTLREAIVDLLESRENELAEADTDAVLALPEFAALIADADNWRRVTTGDPTEPEPVAMQARELLVRNRELEATVARVRELADAYDEGHFWSSQVVDRIRAVLDGEPQS
jgi:hypothetical protein